MPPPSQSANVREAARRKQQSKEISIHGWGKGKATPIMSEWHNRGPFPLPSSINEELEPEIDSLLQYIRIKALPADALTPLVAHLSVPRNEPDMVGMFARATESVAAPLITPSESVQFPRFTDYPGLLCLLPEPLEFGLRAVAIHQLQSKGSHWFLERVKLFARNPSDIPELADRERPSHTFSPVRSVDVLDHVPVLTADPHVQEQFEALVTAGAENRPKSFDEWKQVVPGVREVFIEDGNSLIENLDDITAYQFIGAAESLGLNPSIGKGAYGRLLNSMGNKGLDELRRTASESELRDAAQHLTWRVEHMSKRSSQDIIRETRGRWSYLEVTLDADRAREAVVEILKSKDASFTPNMRRVLSVMFES